MDGILKKLAAKLGTKIKICSIFFPNLTSNSIFSRKVFLGESKSFKIVAYANQENYLVEINFTNFDSEYVFSMNNPDLIIGMKKLIYNLIIDGKAIPIFSLNEYSASKISRLINWFNNIEVNKYWKELDMQELEGIFAYRNKLIFLGHVSQSSRLEERGDLLLNIAKKIPKLNKTPSAILHMPDQFQPYREIIEYLAVSDDLEREERILNIDSSLKEKIIKVKTDLILLIKDYEKSKINEDKVLDLLHSAEEGLMELTTKTI